MEIGPEYEDTGDPEWIQAELRNGGALPGDLYIAVGRWRERIPPTGQHPYDADSRALCRLGLTRALERLGAAVSQLGEPTEQPSAAIAEDPTVRASVAVYEALEWVHSFDEHLRTTEKLYASPTAFDPVYGPYVEGAIGARNASHHGVRRVVGIVTVERVAYEAQGRRWVRTGTHPLHPFLQLRWVEKLPPPPLRWKNQEDAFLEHLAGRDVRNTFAAIVGFFFHHVESQRPPDGLVFTPATAGPPPIDPKALDDAPSPT